jgi:signal transduction histidine kinase
VKIPAHRVARLAALAWRLLLPVMALVAVARAQVLTKAIEVRSLTPAQAEKNLEARLRGTVVFVESSSVFVKDETSTTFFRPQAVGLRVGDEIVVEGRTRMGLYLPGLGASSATVLRHGDRPTGIPVNYDDLVVARYHYQRVAVEGVVRSVTPVDEGRSLLRLAMGSRLLDVRVDAPPESERSLVNSRVRIQGLAAGYHNERRQLVQAHLRAIDWSDVAILEAAAPAAQAPLISPAELLAYQVTGRDDRRIRISGTVTAAFPGDRVFLQQGETAFGVRFGSPITVGVGDRIEIAGFPEMDRFSASVVDAELVSREPGPAPAPVKVGPLEGIVGLHDGQLITVTATLMDAFKTDGGTVLVLQGPKRTLQARLAESLTVPELRSRVEVTAICLVETAQPGSGFSSKMGLVSLRIRNAADVVVLESPPWWTVKRLGLILAGLGAVTLVAGLWIVVLRVQVTRQTAALRQRIEAEAVLEERQRIAREFHDSLEQELAGVSLRLDALGTRELDEKGRTLAATARHLVSRIQSETRSLISDLRDPSESAGDIAAALSGVAARYAAEGGVQVHAEIVSPVPLLPAGMVHDLRMMARESVNNALKHAAANSVKIQLDVKAGRLVMRVVDDGRGFDPAVKMMGKRGHFGCAGIRERCRKLGAEVQWRSEPGGGTTVEVSLPLQGLDLGVASVTRARATTLSGQGDEESFVVI